MYSPELLEHFEHPRNAGVLSSPDASAQLENPVCGDVLKLTAKISNGYIDQIRFQAKGCVPAMACASAITELAAGKTLEAASALRMEQLLARIGGLPPASSHAGHLALDALASLLKSARSSLEQR